MKIMAAIQKGNVPFNHVCLLHAALSKDEQGGRAYI